MTTSANATEKKASKGNAAAVSGDNAAKTSKPKGGNDGVSPRALRGAPKPAAEWSQAQEEAFKKMMEQREAANAIRAQGLGKVLDLLLAGVQPTVFKDAVEGKPAVEADEANGIAAQPAVEAQAAVTEVVANREELLANIEKNGNAILTHLSTFFKLEPTLLKAAEAK